MQNLFTENLLFGGCQPSLAAALGAEIEMMEFTEGTVIFNEGDCGDSMYLVGQGSVKISRLGRGGQQETLGFIEAGNYFGEMALLDGETRSATATALNPCVLGKIGNEAFQRILSLAPPDFYMNFLKGVTGRLRSANTHFIDELMRSERLSVVGTMANTIIHDLKNPMSVILYSAELLARITDSPEASKYTEMIVKSVKRMNGMAQELLDFARGNASLDLAECCVDSVISELDNLMMNAVPDHIRVQKQISYDELLFLDLDRFVRVLANLAKNAVEAMREGGILTISVEAKGDFVAFAVSDTGCGIPPEILARVFEPFVTHGKANGTGLGMAIVKTIVDAHKGEISIASVPGQGTRVEICLPCWQP